MWPQIVAALHVDGANAISFGASTLATALTCLFCVLKGGPADRLGALAFGLGWLSFTAANWTSAFVLGDPHMPLLLGLTIDGVVASAFLALAIRYDNLWLGGAAAFQGLQLAILALERSLSAEGPLASLAGALLTVHNALNFVMMACMAASVMGRVRRGAQAA